MADQQADDMLAADVEQRFAFIMSMADGCDA